MLGSNLKTPALGVDKFSELVFFFYSENVSTPKVEVLNVEFAFKLRIYRSLNSLICLKWIRKNLSTTLHTQFNYLHSRSLPLSRLLYFYFFSGFQAGFTISRPSSLSLFLCQVIFFVVLKHIAVFIYKFSNLFYKYDSLKNNYS